MKPCDWRWIGAGRMERTAGRTKNQLLIYHFYNTELNSMYIGA